MRKRTLGVAVLVLASAVLVTSLFGGVVVGPPPQPPEPPVDFNVNVQNTPLPVEVTNPSGMPIATNTSRTGMGVDGSGIDLDHDTYSMTNVQPIEDQTVMFTGGSVTGHLVFSCDNGIGAVPAGGTLEVETTTVTYRIALPFTSLLRIEHVTAIKPRVYVIRPALPGTSDFYCEMSATVLWYFED